MKFVELSNLAINISQHQLPVKVNEIIFIILAFNDGLINFYTLKRFYWNFFMSQRRDPSVVWKYVPNKDNKTREISIQDA